MIDCWGYCFVNPAPWPVGKNLNKKYDAWGRLRNPSNHSPYTPANEPEPFLGRGYCGHEHLTGFGLINMNARLYDPMLGRFLSPDPYVQAPEHSQSFNRYRDQGDRFLIPLAIKDKGHITACLSLCNSG